MKWQWEVHLLRQIVFLFIRLDRTLQEIIDKLLPLVREGKVLSQIVGIIV